MALEFLKNTPMADADTKNNVSLYCDNYNSETNNCGVVVVDGKQLFPTLPYSKEVPLNKITDFFLSEDAHFTMAHEGTLIRVFCVHGVWYTSSNKRLDIFQSFWADDTTSFGETFAMAVRNELGLDHDSDDQLDLMDFFNTYLDPKHAYFFILRTTEQERIVCLAPDTATAYHVATAKNGAIDFNDRIKLCNNDTFLHPSPLLFSGPDELKNFVHDTNHNKFQGVICIKDGVHYKFLSPAYERLAKLRNNTPSIRNRYLNLRNPACKEDCDAFLELYPNFAATVEQLEDELGTLCGIVHQSYLRCYVYRNSSPVSPELHRIHRQLHRIYLNTRQPTTLCKAHDVLITQSPSLLNTLLRQYVTD